LDDDLIAAVEPLKFTHAFTGEVDGRFVKSEPSTAGSATGP
jgi:hypothetical protein